MKKLLLATSVAAVSATAAQAAPVVVAPVAVTGVPTTVVVQKEAAPKSGPELYGKVGIKAEYTKDLDSNNSSDNVKFGNKSTRIGIKGSEGLTPSVKGVYQLEYGLDLLDENKDKQFAPRDTFVGLEHDEAGSLTFGRITSIADNIDLSSPSEPGGYISDYDAGTRWNKSVVYSTPDFNGLSVMAQVALDDEVVESNGYVYDKDTKVASEDKKGYRVNVIPKGSYSVAGKYEMGNIGVGASYTDVKNNNEPYDKDGNPIIILTGNGVGSLSGGEIDDVYRVSGAVGLSDEVKLSALYQQTNYKDNWVLQNDLTLAKASKASEKAYTAAVEYAIPNSKAGVYAQYDHTNNFKGTNTTAQGYSAGAKYGLTKSTKLQAYAGVVDLDTKADGKELTVGTNLVHSF